MSLLSDLDLAYFCLVSHISVPAGQNIDNGKRPYFIISGLYEFHLWVIMFSAILQKCVFGDNFLTKACMMMILVSGLYFGGQGIRWHHSFLPASDHA